MLDYTFVVSVVSTTKGSRLLRSGGGGGRGLVGVCVRAWIACIRMRAQLLWVGSRNVVSDSAGFSISNAVVLAKSPF